MLGRSMQRRAQKRCCSRASVYTAGTVADKAYPSQRRHAQKSWALGGPTGSCDHQLWPPRPRATAWPRSCLELSLHAALASESSHTPCLGLLLQAAQAAELSHSGCLGLSLHAAQASLFPCVPHTYYLVWSRQSDEGSAFWHGSGYILLQTAACSVVVMTVQTLACIVLAAAQADLSMSAALKQSAPQTDQMAEWANHTWG